MATLSQHLSSSSQQKKMSLSNPIPLSQQKSPLVSDNFFTMPIAKFSYANTPRLQSRPTWTHLPDRDNMFAVFDLVSSKGSGDCVIRRNVLKVVRGGDLIESIDLDDLRQQVLKDEACAGSMNIQDADRLVYIIVKPPLVAIRYPLPNGQVRRLQMKFVQEHDYTMAVCLLRRLELPIRDPNPTSRPHTVTSNGSSTAQPHPASAVPQPHDEHLSSRQASVSAPSNHDIAARSSSVMLGSSPYLGSSYNSGLTQRPTTLQRSTSMFNHSSRDELPPPPRPTSSSIIFNSGLSPQHAPITSAGLIPGAYFTPSRTILESPSRMSSVAASSPSVGGVFGSSMARVNLTPTMPRRTLFEEKLSGIQRSSNAGINHDDNLDHLLPPKRELPFAKPQSKPPSRDAFPAMQPTSSLDPLSTPSRVGTKKPTTSAFTLNAKAKHPTSAAAKPKQLATDLLTTELSVGHTSPSYKASNLPESSEYNPTDIPPSSLPLRASKLVDNEVPDEYITRMNAFLQKYRDRSAAKRYFNDAAAERAAFAALPETERLASIDDFFQKHHDRSAAETHLDGAAMNRATFAALPETERLAAIDDEIMECIMDANFPQLCADVDKACKRLASGL